MKIQELIATYESKLLKLEQYFELSKTHDSFIACIKIQVEITIVKELIENLKTIK